MKSTKRILIGVVAVATLAFSAAFSPSSGRENAEDATATIVSSEEAVIPESLVPSEQDALRIAALEYLKIFHHGLIQARPLPVTIGDKINGFAAASDRLWEVRFVIPGKGLHALVFVNAENGLAHVVCGGGASGDRPCQDAVVNSD